MSPKPIRTARLRLLDIRLEIDLLRDIQASMGVDEAISNRVYRHAIERCLSNISEASRHLPRHVTAKETEIAWADIRGIGNILRHDYEVISPRLLRSILVNDIDPLDAACERLLATSLPDDTT